jgi:hypothetical protein
MNLQYEIRLPICRDDWECLHSWRNFCSGSHEWSWKDFHSGSWKIFIWVLGRVVLVRIFTQVFRGVLERIFTQVLRRVLGRIFTRVLGRVLDRIFTQVHPPTPTASCDGHHHRPCLPPCRRSMLMLHPTAATTLRDHLRPRLPPHRQSM